MSEQKKKNNIVVLVIIIVLVVAIGGYAIWQTQDKNNLKVNDKTVASTTTTQTTATTDNQEVNFINKEITLKVGDTSTLLVNAPENPELKWSSSDTSVVTVENGNIKGIAKGTATITVQLGNSVDTCTVNVKEKKKSTKNITEIIPLSHNDIGKNIESYIEKIPDIKKQKDDYYAYTYSNDVVSFGVGETGNINSIDIDFTVKSNDVEYKLEGYDITNTVNDVRNNYNPDIITIDDGSSICINVSDGIYLKFYLTPNGKISNGSIFIGD